MYSQGCGGSSPFFGTSFFAFLAERGIPIVPTSYWTDEVLRLVVADSQAFFLKREFQPGHGSMLAQRHANTVGLGLYFIARPERVSALDGHMFAQAEAQRAN